MKQTANLDKFNNLGGRPTELFKIAFTLNGELRWVKHFEDRALFDSAVARYTGPGGYGLSRLPGLRLDFLQLVAVHETLEWFATQQPLEHPAESA